MTILNGLKSIAEGATLVGGIPSWWRTRTNDSKPEEPWQKVYLAYDILSPWTVGRYSDAASWSRYQQSIIIGDLAETSLRRKAYLPVIFPGYSFFNGSKGDAGLFNRIPRQCGSFYWMQARDLLQSGRVDMIYTAMFDEIDEGTAIMPVAARQEATPQGAHLVTLDQEQCSLPTDWYLTLAAKVSDALHRKGSLNEMPALGPRKE